MSRLFTPATTTSSKWPRTSGGGESSRPNNMTNLFLGRIAALVLLFSILAACSSSGGTAQPPPPPVPVAPPAPPPPDPTFEERLAEWAERDPNACRAQTLGFEALGGWLKNDGRELGPSRVWIDDVSELSDSSGHGAQVWSTFTACAVRSTEAQFFTDAQAMYRAQEEDGRDAIESLSLGLVRPPNESDPYPAPDYLEAVFDGMRDGLRLLRVQGAGNDDGLITSELWDANFQAALEAKDTALRVLVAGYTGEGDDRRPHPESSICGDADALCLYGPFEEGGKAGTSIATPQVAAALDTVWTVWPSMDILDLRNLAFDCAEDMPAPEGEDLVTRQYSYSNGRTFTSETNSRWGHGIFSLTCLFTPNGGLQDPTTGTPISGGLYGPLAGPITRAAITGVDYTGRDFGYGFARPMQRENPALAVTANLRIAERRIGHRAVRHRFHGAGASLWRRGPLGIDFAASHSALGAALQWQGFGWTGRSGLAVQPDGAGPLIGTRSFRAPATLSTSLTIAFGRTLAAGLSIHLQADHWRTLATGGRSLWKSANLRESRLTATFVKRTRGNEFALMGVWHSGLTGALNVSGRSWALAPRPRQGVWLTWTRAGAWER